MIEVLENLENQTDEEEIPVMLTVSQCAALANLGRDIIYRWVKTGQLPCVKSGAKSYISKKNFIKFLNGESVGENQEVTG